MKYFLSVSLILLFISQSSGQSDIEINNETIDLSESESHVWFLASDELMGRDTGSPGLEAAASYIAAKFRSYGVKPLGSDNSYFQPVPLQKVGPPKNGVLEVGDKRFALGENLVLIQTKSISTEAEVVFMHYGMPDQLTSDKVEGKIVVAMAGNESVSDPRAFFSLGAEKRQAAQDAGALAFFETYSSNQMPWSLIMNFMNRERISLGATNHEDNFPHGWLSDPSKEITQYFTNERNLTGGVEISEANIQTISSKNVVGLIPGTDQTLKDEYILISAHYDHVGYNTGTGAADSIFNGARDNAIGISALLTTARSFSKMPPKRSIIFLACTAEEKGLLGSRYFAQNLPVEASQIVFNLNTDGGGYNDKTVASIMGLHRTTAESQMISACEEYGLNAFADPAPEQNLFDRSDNVNFAQLGIPAPTFSTGFTSFDEEITKYYHQVTDNPDNVDYEYLGKYWKAFALAARRIANMNEAPFWVAGDKYEEAGKALYKRQ